MKTCPVCGGKLFDDMEVCYGCLHSFSDETAAKEHVRGSREATMPLPLIAESHEGPHGGEQAKMTKGEPLGALENADARKPQAAADGSSAQPVASLPLSQGYRLVISVEPAPEAPTTKVLLAP